MKPRITEVKEAPKIAGLYIQQGFRNSEDVMKWALCHGYAEVYYMKSHQRVYVDRSKLLVEKARQTARESQELRDILEKTLAAVEAL